MKRRSFLASIFAAAAAPAYVKAASLMPVSTWTAGPSGILTRGGDVLAALNEALKPGPMLQLLDAGGLVLCSMALGSDGGMAGDHQVEMTGTVTSFRVALPDGRSGTGRVSTPEEGGDGFMLNTRHLCMGGALVMMPGSKIVMGNQ